MSRGAVCMQPDAQIAELRVEEARATPAGVLERRFEIDFVDIDGSISLWSTGYEVELFHAPVLSDVPSLPRRTVEQP